MSSLMTSLRRLLGGASDTPAKDRLKAQEDFKTAVRANDLPAMDALLDAKRIALGDEFAGGRGLLQFAVMVKSAKAARRLVERGADAGKVDTLGASADTLARKSGSAGMTQALQPA